ncbi:MAG: response regulator [Balneolales bacterium]
MKHILIVDDEYIISWSIGIFFEKLGYKITTGITKGEEIIESVKKEHYDLILIDVKLQKGLDGIEIITRIRTFSSIPVIYLTTNITDKSMHERAKKTNPIGFISKPLDYDELKNTVEQCWKSTSG